MIQIRPYKHLFVVDVPTTKWPITLSVFRKFKHIKIFDIENHFRILDYNTINEVIIDCIHIHKSEYSWNLPPNGRNVFFTINTGKMN